MVAPGGLAVRDLTPPEAIQAPPTFSNWLITCMALASAVVSQSTITLLPAPSPAPSASRAEAICRCGVDVVDRSSTQATCVSSSHCGGAVFSLPTVRTTWRSDPSATAAVMTIPGEALSIQATRAPDGEKRGTRCELAGVASRRTAGRELQSPS